MSDASTVRAAASKDEPAESGIEFVAPKQFGAYAASKENARMYVRVVLGDDVIPPASDVSGFWDVLDEVG